MPNDPATEETPVELIANPNPKAGWKSTEFWMVLAANLIAVALFMLGKLDAEWAITAVSILTGLYTMLRNSLKRDAANAAASSSEII